MADGNLGTDTVNMMENVMGSLNFAGLVTATLGSLIAWSKPFRITDRNEKDLEEKQKKSCKANMLR
jgi:hypothetical protein